MPITHENRSFALRPFYVCNAFKISQDDDILKQMTNRALVRQMNLILLFTATWNCKYAAAIISQAIKRDRSDCQEHLKFRYS